MTKAEKVEFAQGMLKGAYFENAQINFVEAGGFVCFNKCFAVIFQFDDFSKTFSPVK